MWERLKVFLDLKQIGGATAAPPAAAAAAIARSMQLARPIYFMGTCLRINIDLVSHRIPISPKGAKVIYIRLKQNVIWNSGDHSTPPMTSKTQDILYTQQRPTTTTTIKVWQQDPLIITGDNLHGQLRRVIIEKTDVKRTLNVYAFQQNIMSIRIRFTTTLDSFVGPIKFIFKLNSFVVVCPIVLTNDLSF